MFHTVSPWFSLFWGVSWWVLFGCLCWVCASLCLFSSRPHDRQSCNGARGNGEKTKKRIPETGSFFMWKTGAAVKDLHRSNTRRFTWMHTSTFSLLGAFLFLPYTYPFLPLLLSPPRHSSRVYSQWHSTQSPKLSLWPLVTGIHPIPSAGSVSDGFSSSCMRLYTPNYLLVLIRNLLRLACFVNSFVRFLILNLHPTCTCSC